LYFAALPNAGLPATKKVAITGIKSEYRNTKQIRMFEIQNPKQGRTPMGWMAVSCFDIRIYDFEFV
jgi:hypothetical protein